MGYQIEDLGTVIDESTVLAAAVDEEARALRLRLAIKAYPRPGSSAQPEVEVVFGSVARVAARVVDVEFFPDPSEDQPWKMGSREVGAEIEVPDTATLNVWLQRFAGDLYGQPYPMFAREDPDWLLAASTDQRWAPTALHTMDLSFDCGPNAGRRYMSLRAWFKDIRVFDSAGNEQPWSDVYEAVRQWWRDLKQGRTHGQYGVVPAGGPRRAAEH